MSETPARAREGVSKNDEGIPADIEAGEKPEAPERSSDAVLHPGMQAEPTKLDPALPVKAGRPGFQPVLVVPRQPARSPAEKAAIRRKQAEKHLRFLSDRCGSRAAAEYLDIVAPTELAGGRQPATAKATAIFERTDDAMLGALATGLWRDIPAPWYPEHGIVPRHADGNRGRLSKPSSWRPRPNRRRRHR